MSYSWVFYSPSRTIWPRQSSCASLAAGRLACFKVARGRDKKRLSYSASRIQDSMVAIAKTRCALVLGVLLSLATRSAQAAPPPLDEKDDRNVQNVEVSRADKKHQDHAVNIELPHNQRSPDHLKTKVVAQKFK
nr:uncharacterized protein LOC129388192 [Dermacentor andersoni]